MALKDLEPFEGLSVITTEMDEIEVGHLLRVNKDLSLTCQDCGSNRFKVEAFIPVELDMIAGKHTIITHIDHKKVIINRVVKCAYCDCTDFITLDNSGQEKDNG